MRTLPRHPWDLLLLGAASFGFTLAWIQYSSAPRAAGTLSLIAWPTGAPSVDSASAPQADAAQPPPAAVVNVDELLSAATGDFAENRLAAIMALADAPRGRALPVLLRIARTSSVVADRHAALDSLLVQGLQQRDSDDPIPDLLRELIYDGDDEEVSEHAARVLEQLNAAAPS